MDTYGNNPDLRQEASAARILADAMRDNGYDADDIALVVESESNFMEAVAGCVRRIAELDGMETAVKQLAAHYRDRADALSFKRDRLRDALVEAIDRSGVPLPLRMAEATVSVTSPAPSARIIDETLLPEEFVRTKVTTSPDMKAITKVLRDGIDVPGAVLANASRSLMVRTR